MCGNLLYDSFTYFMCVWIGCLIVGWFLCVLRIKLKVLWLVVWFASKIYNVLRKDISSLSQLNLISPMYFKSILSQIYIPMVLGIIAILVRKLNVFTS